MNACALLSLAPLQLQQQQQQQAVTAAAEGSITSHTLHHCTLHLLDPLRHAKNLAAVTAQADIVLSVHRIENASLQRRYDEAKQRLQQSGEQHQTDVIAYHGTGRNNPALIYDSPTGFDISKGHCAKG